MAKEDASAAIQNALQKLDQQPNLLHNDEKLKSLKSNLHHFGSRLDRFNSISKLTEIREVAYDAEDAMDDVIMVAATTSARKRWRRMGNSILFFARAGKPSQQLVEDKIDAVNKRSDSISSNYDGVVVDEEEQEIAAVVVDEQDTASEKDLSYLSLSGFPADVEVSARQLIQVWVAEGHLDRQGIASMEMEEQGRGKINWLVQRGYIKQASKGTCGELKTFKIEKDRLDRCREAAKAEEFLHVSAGDDQETGQVKTTRLAIHGQAGSLFPGSNLRSSVKLPDVRSLQFHCKESTLDLRFFKSWKKEFESLRVLDLGCFKLETVPEAIGRLKHLRYLRLRAPEATKIPASICNLRHLETMDLKGTNRVKNMPVEIWKMKENLRHIHLGDGATALPPPQWANHYDALDKLQTLCGVRPDKELKRLMVRAKFPNVNRLRVQCTNKSDSPEFLSFLNSLDLLSDLRSLTLRGPIEDLPSDWTAFPSSMTKMTLSKTRIPAGKCMKTLEKLQNLRYLKLVEDSVTGEEMKCAEGSFPALQVLKMIGLNELKLWTVEEGAMRLLGDLEVRRCGKLEKVKAFQPSKKLFETLQEFQKEHEHVNVEGNPRPAKSNGTTAS